MNFRRFACNNVLRNKRIYVAHFLSSAFSVMIFFTYALLAFHPDLKGQIVSSSGTLSLLGTMGMRVSQYIVFIFSFFFLLFSAGSFIKLRKKEFGVLLLLGMSHKQLGRMLFIENIMIGLASTITGILVGVVFSKLILLISANMLAIEHGLPIYLPTKAVALTAGCYLVLFVLIAFTTSLMTRKGSIAQLIQADDKPKPEPKASVWLSTLAVLLILLGYGCVFIFASRRILSFLLLLSGVALVILGTYFLFTQLSVFVLRAMKKRPSFFFRKTNMLTVSELLYRIKDNAVMFFMVSIISAAAFTGIGTCLALGDPGLAAMTNPYAFTYRSNPDNALEQQQLHEIGQALEKNGFTYKIASFTANYSENGINFFKLSDYNKLAKALGYPEETLEKDQLMFTPTTVGKKSEYRLHGVNEQQVTLTKEDREYTFKVKQTEPYIVFPEWDRAVIIPDEAFQKFVLESEKYGVTYEFIVPDWQHTRDIASQLMKSIDEKGGGYNKYYAYFDALVLNWIESRQLNGMLFIVSGLVGIVFFTFAASFIYFRLYADLNRDEQQYRMISKVGLGRKELKKTISKQLMIMFFLPIVMAIIHSTVAFIALQQLVEFSVFQHSLSIFISFVLVQVVYFGIARWRYLDHLYQKLA